VTVYPSFKILYFLGTEWSSLEACNQPFFFPPYTKVFRIRRMKQLPVSLSISQNSQKTSNISSNNVTLVHCHGNYQLRFQSALGQPLYLDFAGPIDGHYLLILVDAYLKFMDVATTSTISAPHTVELCREMFARYGSPDVLISDHGTQFTSDLFAQFCKELQITSSRLPITLNQMARQRGWSIL